jgi:lipoic acid synthetase
MVMGDVCTRACRFCATETGKPLPISSGEPHSVARSVALMGLKHVVVTSVTRDDLPDGGAAHWARVIEAVRAENPHTTIEVLIPDFWGRAELLDVVLAARPDIVGHNVETVERITPAVRSRATYGGSLGVLRYIATQREFEFAGQTRQHDAGGGGGLKLDSALARRRAAVGHVTKSGLMVGLGERPDEVLQALDDLREAGVKVVTLGQYLQPTRGHVAVAEYVTPSMFEFYREQAVARGFIHVASGPLVRSSYMAEKALAVIATAAAAGTPAADLATAATAAASLATRK